jgi:serine phosphatase RsbU (regulator of sigma subunit)
VVHRYGAKRISLGYKDGLDAAHLPQTQLITYKSGDVFAIVTDGLTDQVGGAQSSGKPVSFGYRRLERILLETSEQAADEIASTIKQHFEQWQGENKRRDDVTVLVFKL